MFLSKKDHFAIINGLLLLARAASIHTLKRNPRLKKRLFEDKEARIQRSSSSLHQTVPRVKYMIFNHVINNESLTEYGAGWVAHDVAILRRDGV